MDIDHFGREFKEDKYEFYKAGYIPSTNYLWSIGDIIFDLTDLQSNINDGHWLFQLRLRLAYSLISRGMLEKKLYHNGNRKKISLVDITDGIVRPFNNWTYCVINEVSDEQIVKVIKYNKWLETELSRINLKIQNTAKSENRKSELEILKELFKRLGLHIVSIDMLPEYDYGCSSLRDETNKIFSTPGNIWHDWGIDYIENGNDRILNELEIIGFREDCTCETGNLNPDNYRLENVKRSIYKLKLIRHLRLGNTVKVPWNVSGITVEYGDGNTPIGLSEFIKKYEELGYEFDKNYGKVYINEPQIMFGTLINEFFYINLNLPEHRSSVRIYVDGKKIKGELIMVIDSVLAPLDPDPNNPTKLNPIYQRFKNLLESNSRLSKKEDTLFPPRYDGTYDDDNFLTNWDKSIIQYEEIADSYKSLPIVRLFNRNITVLIQLMEDSSDFKNFALQFFLFYDSSKNLTPKGKDFSERLLSLYNFFTELKTSNWIGQGGEIILPSKPEPTYFYYSPYKFSRYAGIEQENLVTLVTGIGLPIIFTMEISSITNQ